MRIPFPKYKVNDVVYFKAKDIVWCMTVTNRWFDKEQRCWSYSLEGNTYEVEAILEYQIIGFIKN